MGVIRYITSDCDAVSIIYDVQRYAKKPEDAVVDVLKAGAVGPFLPCLPSFWFFYLIKKK